MRLRILFVALALCVAPDAIAQSKPIYFVVDASGSMKGDNKREAEELLRGLSLPRGQQISITYFGGKPATKGSDLCVETIVPPAPTIRGTILTLTFPELGGSEDKTAISNAVGSVLRSIKGPAKLILITDGIEECSADYDAIRKRYPDAEIEVRLVGLVPNPDLQRLENKSVGEQSSGAAAQSRSAPLVNFGIQFASPPHNPNRGDLSIDWSVFHFLEKWFWLIGIVLVGGAAVKWGLDRQKMALERETTSGHLQQLRLAALVDGNEEARKKLRAAISAANSLRDKLKAQEDNSKSQSILRRFSTRTRRASLFAWQHKFGTAGLLILIALPLLSRGFEVGPFSVGRAQEAAWTALDSSFAEAFSLIAIAIVFFAASQQRRLNEAVEKFGLATEQAEWAEAQLKSDKEKSARTRYAAAITDLRKLTFSSPQQTARKPLPSRVNADEHAFRVVTEAAVALAAGTNPIGPASTAETIEAETLIIEQIVSAARPNILWPLLQKPPFARFLDAVLMKRPELSNRSEFDSWKTLASQVQPRDSWPTIRHLAQLLTNQSAAASI